MKLIFFVRKLWLFRILRKEFIFSFFLAFLDLAVLTLSYQLSYWLACWTCKDWFFVNPNALTVYFISIPIWILLLIATNNNQIPRTTRYSRLISSFLQFGAANLILSGIVAIFLDVNQLSFGIHFALAFGAISFVLLFVARLIEYKLFKIYRANGFNFINTAVIADGTSIPFIEDMISKKEWGYNVLFILTNSKLVKAHFAGRVKVMPEAGLHTLCTLMEVYNVEEVVYMQRSIRQFPINQVIRWCEEVGVIFRIPSSLSPFSLTTGKMSFIGNNKFITFTNVPTNPFGITWKNFFDFFGALIILCMVTPFLLMVALWIRLDSKGPIFFKQARVGLRGRQFYLYKFRTMVVNAEALKATLEAQNEMDGPVFKIKKDPRITKAGVILRKTGLDELPQLLNVIKGEMSLIGPRPPLMKEVQQYKRWQLRRLSVKPGITCTWQIQPDRNNIQFEEWMELDLKYIDKWSPKQDILLLFKTVRTVIFGTGS